MNIPQNFWKTLTGLAGILIALVAVLLVKEIKAVGYVGAGIQPTDTISVDGTGDAYAVPDIATFSFTVTETAKAVTDAQSQATAKVNTDLAAVKAAGVVDKDIQTTSYNISPHYEYQNAVCPAIANTIGTPVYCPPGKSVLTGYDVSQTVTFKVRNLDTAGSILASLGSLQVDNLNGPDFSVDDPNAVQAEARAKAIADAQSKATALAQQLGVHLVRIVSFAEDNGSSPSPIIYAMSASVSGSKAAPAPQIPAGQQKVTDNVTITYEIQ